MDRFEKEKQRLEEEIKILEHRYSVYGTVRFIVFLVMAAGIIIGVYDSKTVWLVAGFAAAVGFVALVFLHGRVNENLEYARAKKLVPQNPQQPQIQPQAIRSYCRTHLL